jgi:5-dehydro-4-deoxyglucarate dehydratase
MVTRRETVNADELRRTLRGVIAFPVTPFTSDLALDIAGLRQNLRRVVEHPLAAIVAAGGTGEIYSLSPEEHSQAVRATVEEVQGKFPVIAGVGFNTAIGIAMARAAEKAGAGALLILPPYYPNADEEGLADYYAAIAGATSLGVFVYSRDWVNPGAAWVERLAARIPNLAGWKDGQGDTRRYQQIMHKVGNRLHWIGGAGDDCVSGYYSIGIRAYTSSIATVAPKLSIQLHEAACAGDRDTLSRLMADYVIPLYALRARRKGYEVTVMKEMMNLTGQAAGPVRPPLPAMCSEDIAELKAILERWRPFLS